MVDESQIDQTQKYFWTEAWQEKMKRSQEALLNGESKTFPNMEESIKDLEVLAHANSTKD